MGEGLVSLRIFFIIAPQEENCQRGHFVKKTQKSKKKKLSIDIWGAVWYDTTQ